MFPPPLATLLQVNTSLSHLRSMAGVSTVPSFTADKSRIFGDSITRVPPSACGIPFFSLDQGIWRWHLGRQWQLDQRDELRSFLGGLRRCFMTGVCSTQEPHRVLMCTNTPARVVRRGGLVPIMNRNKQRFILSSLGSYSSKRNFHEETPVPFII